MSDWIVFGSRPRKSGVEITAVIQNPSSYLQKKSDQSITDSIVIPALKIDVFPITQATRAVIDYTASDRRLAKSHWKFYDGGISAAISLYKDQPSANLILIENNDDPQSLFSALEGLAQECLPETKVILISQNNDVNLYRELIASGVTDELTTPLQSMTLVEAIAKAWEDEAAPRIGRLIAFIGARGGVGSSTVAHNVAAAMARRHETQTLLADLDLQFGTVGLDFDVDGSYGMNDILSSASRLDDVLLDRIVLKYADNLQLLASEPTLDRVADVHGGAIEKLLELAQTTERHVLLDMPRIWTRRTKQAMISADQIIITATPDLTSLRNTKTITEFLRQARPNDPMPILVMNQVGQPRRPEIPLAEFAESVRLDEGHVIPFNASLFGRAANNGQVVTMYSERSRLAQIFNEISEEILTPGVKRRSVSFQRRLVRFLRKYW